MNGWKCCMLLIPSLAAVTVFGSTNAPAGRFVRAPAFFVATREARLTGGKMVERTTRKTDALRWLDKPVDTVRNSRGVRTWTEFGTSYGYEINLSSERDVPALVFFAVLIERADTSRAIYVNKGIGLPNTVDKTEVPSGWCALDNATPDASRREMYAVPSSRTQALSRLSSDPKLPIAGRVYDAKAISRVTVEQQWFTFTGRLPTGARFLAWHCELWHKGVLLDSFTGQQVEELRKRGIPLNWPELDYVDVVRK